MSSQNFFQKIEKKTLMTSFFRSRDQNWDRFRKNFADSVLDESVSTQCRRQSNRSEGALGKSGGD